MKPHKHAELIKAWADGAEIQISVSKGELWEDAQPNFLVWNDEYQYRIKPEPKPDVVMYARIRKPEIRSSNSIAFISSAYTNPPISSEQCNLQIIFDGETGKPKSAEVLK